MMKLTRLLSLASLWMAFLPSLTQAANGAPKFIEYQGTVLAADGSPLASAQSRLYKMEFRLWDQLEGGTLIWSEQQYVNVFNGQFTVRLGEGQPAEDAVAPQVEQGELDAAFAGQSRYLGITVINPPNPNAEIAPRLVFNSVPYAVVANAAKRLVQQPGTFSTMLSSSIAYSTQSLSGSAAVTLNLDKRVNLIGASASGTVATLPANGALRELVVVKTDATDKFVAVSAPAGGKINAALSIVRLKVQGESVTLQNVGGNDWWIVKDSRDTTPVGTIIAYGGTTAPKGYLPCDGTSRLRSDHPDLFSAIGETWGKTTSTNFHLPDFSGRFQRGINPGDPGEDTDIGLRTSINGSASGLAVGSYQLDQFLKHLHGITDPGHTHGVTMSVNGPAVPVSYFNTDTNALGGLAANPPGDAVTWNMNFTSKVEEAFTGLTATGGVTVVTAGTETRPKNAVVNYCIKY